MKIWGRANSINVMKVLWCADECGIAYDRENVGLQYGGNDQKWYLDMNPNGVVPTIDDGGQIIWESNSAVRYLAAKYAAGTLWPNDPGQRSEADRWMDWVATTVWLNLRPVFWNLVRTPPEKRDPAALEASWRGWQGWPLVVPSGRDSGMTLLGYRRCVITEGRLAHLLYRRNGETLSLFVMPDGPHVDHTELEMFGQDAVLWESHGLTYALVGRGDRAAMAAVAASLEREVNARAASTTPAVPER